MKGTTTTPEKVVLFTMGVPYGFETPPPTTNVFEKLPPLTDVEVSKITSVKVADVDGDSEKLSDVIVTYVDGTTKVYLNPGTNNFESVDPIVIEVDPDVVVMDVTVADVNKDGAPDIITANYNEKNKLYLGTAGAFQYDSTSFKYTGVAK